MINFKVTSSSESTTKLTIIGHISDYEIVVNGEVLSGIKKDKLMLELHGWKVKR